MNRGKLLSILILLWVHPAVCDVLCSFVHEDTVLTSYEITVWLPLSLYIGECVRGDIHFIEAINYTFLLLFLISLLTPLASNPRPLLRHLAFLVGFSHQAANLYLRYMPIEWVFSTSVLFALAFITAIVTCLVVSIYLFCILDLTALELVQTLIVITMRPIINYIFNNFNLPNPPIYQFWCMDIPCSVHLLDITYAILSLVCLILLQPVMMRYSTALDTPVWYLAFLSAVYVWITTFYIKYTSAGSIIFLPPSLCYSLIVVILFVCTLYLYLFGVFFVALMNAPKVYEHYSARAGGIRQSIRTLILYFLALAFLVLGLCICAVTCVCCIWVVLVICAMIIGP